MRSLYLRHPVSVSDQRTMQQLVEQAVEIRALANTVAESPPPPPPSPPPPAVPAAPRVPPCPEPVSKGCQERLATALDPHFLRVDSAARGERYEGQAFTSRSGTALDKLTGNVGVILNPAFNYLNARRQPPYRIAAISAMHSPHTATSRSMSASLAIGGTSIMLWKGVISTPRFSRNRWV